jgi:hypothetical protein
MTLCGRSLPQQVVNGLPRKTSLRSDLSNGDAFFLRFADRLRQFLSRPPSSLSRGLSALYSPVNPLDGLRRAHFPALSKRLWNIDRWPLNRSL